MSRMSVLVDCSELNPFNLGGVQSYSLSMSRAIANDPNTDVALLITEASLGIFKEICGSLPRGSVLVLRNRGMLTKIFLGACLFLNLSRLYLRIKYAPIKRLVGDRKIDVVYTPTTYLNFNLPNSKSIVTIHDIQEKDMPENFSRGELRYRDFRTRLTLKKALGIHVSSIFIRNSIEKHYPVESNKKNIFVVSEGVDINKFKCESIKKKRQIVFPARPWPHKNHKILFSALEILEGKNPPKVILTGTTGQDLARYTQSRSGNVEFRGFVPETEISLLYCESFAVISCSLYESSSLPILEGVASQCVALASSIPAHKEMGEKLKIDFFDPRDAKDLAAKISQLALRYDAEELTYSENIEKIKLFSWSAVSGKLLVEITTILNRENQ